MRASNVYVFITRPYTPTKLFIFFITIQSLYINSYITFKKVYPAIFCLLFSVLWFIRGKLMYLCVVGTDRFYLLHIKLWWISCIVRRFSANWVIGMNREKCIPRAERLIQFSLGILLFLFLFTTFFISGTALFMKL